MRPRKSFLQIDSGNKESTDYEDEINRNTAISFDICFSYNPHIILFTKNFFFIDALDQSPSAKIQSVYISKYNRFVDNIMGKINRILGKSYDPVRVKIQPPKTTKKTKNNKKKTTKRKSTKRPAARKPAATNKMVEVEVARAHESEVREPAFVLVSKASHTVPRRRNNTVQIRPATSNKTKRTKTKSKTKKNKTKANGNGKKAPKVRATLFGLSSLRRDGDVDVRTMSDHTTVKSDFVLGPLTLRVEKEVSPI